MTTKELRHKVIDRINKLDDESLLNDLIKIIDNTINEDEIYRLSDEHKKAVNTAINQIEKGDYLTHEQSNKQIDEWLNN